MHQGGHPGGAHVKVVPSEQLHLEKVLTASGAKYPLAHVVTRHFTIAAGASMADMDSLFTGQIPTKVLISLVSNEASVSTWQKNLYNFAHTELNSACLVVDGRPLLAQPWQPDYMQGLYAETYHSLLKFSGMYPSYWNNEMSVEHFVVGIMLLSWDPTPDDSNGVAYLSPRHLGTIKASLRFAKLLLATTTLIAYAQYDNLVVVDCLPDQHGSWRGCWGTLTMCFPQGLSACRVLQFLRHHTTGVYLPTVAEHGLPGHMVQYKNAAGTVLKVLRTLRFLLPGHVQPGCALGHHYWWIPAIRLQWGPYQMPSKMTYTCIYTATATANCH